jgi:hypothetical protein
MKSTCFIFLILFILFVDQSVVQSANSYVAKIDENSHISIKGRSNVNTFVFEQKGPFMSDQINVSFTDDGKHDILKPISMPIEIKKFDCDNKLMKRDFFKTLNADLYPYLTITISKIELQNNALVKENSTVRGNVHVSIKLAGVLCDYSIPFFMMAKKNKLMIVGEKKLAFSDFNLSPPAKFFGAIQVDNDLEISVNLMVSYTHI